MVRVEDDAAFQVAAGMALGSVKDNGNLRMVVAMPPASWDSADGPGGPPGPERILWDCLQEIFSGTWACDPKLPEGHDSCLSHCIELRILEAQKAYRAAVEGKREFAFELPQLWLTGEGALAHFISVNCRPVQVPKVPRGQVRL